LTLEEAALILARLDKIIKSLESYAKNMEGADDVHSIHWNPTRYYYYNYN